MLEREREREREVEIDGLKSELIETFK